MSAAVNEDTLNSLENAIQIVKSKDFQTIVIALAILVLGFVAVRLILRLEKRLLKKSRLLPPSSHTIVRTLTRVILDIVVVLTAAGYVGIPLTSFVVVLSVAGVAISLAIQGLLSNLVGGFIILGAEPLRVGDYVEANGMAGTVIEIRMIYTRLQSPDGRLIYIPNSTLYTSQVINYSALGKRRIDLNVSAAYGNSPEQVHEAIDLAISRTEGLLADPEPLVWLESYDSSGITYSLHVWCPGNDFLGRKYALNEALWTAFRDKGITFPFPQLDVHLDPTEKS